LAKRCISNRTAEVAYVPRIWLLQLDSKFSPDKRWNWTKEKDKGHGKSNRLERNAKKKFAG